MSKYDVISLRQTHCCRSELHFIDVDAISCLLAGQSVAKNLSSFSTGYVSKATNYNEFIHQSCVIIVDPGSFKLTAQIVDLHWPLFVSFLQQVEQIIKKLNAHDVTIKADKGRSSLVLDDLDTFPYSNKLPSVVVENSKAVLTYSHVIKIFNPNG